MGELAVGIAIATVDCAFGAVGDVLDFGEVTLVEKEGAGGGEIGVFEHYAAAGTDGLIVEFYPIIGGEPAFAQNWLVD